MDMFLRVISSSLLNRFLRPTLIFHSREVCCRLAEKCSGSGDCRKDRTYRRDYVSQLYGYQEREGHHARQG